MWVGESAGEKVGQMAVLSVVSTVEMSEGLKDYMSVAWSVDEMDEQTVAATVELMVLSLVAKLGNVLVADLADDSAGLLVA